MPAVDALIRSCPACGRGNRVPLKHLGDRGRCGHCKGELSPTNEALEVDAERFEAILSSSPMPLLVDFWAPWCGPCRTAAPEVGKVAQRLAGRVLVLKVNTEEQPELAARYSVRSIPNFAVFSKGHLVRQQPGLMNHQQLERLVLESV